MGYGDPDTDKLGVNIDVLNHVSRNFDIDKTAHLSLLLLGANAPH